ncbi:AMP-binding protein, partial [Corynebacterium sp.]
AVLSHRNICANLIQGKAWVPGLGEQADPERMLAALPMFHAYGMTMNGALAPLIGGELLLLPAPEPSLLQQVIKKKKPTWVPGVPALYQAIVKLAEEKDLDLSTMRNSFSGASALPVETVENWEKLTHGRLVEGYGLTETSPIVLGNPMSDDRRPGYVGVPFPDTEARVVDQDDPTKVLDYGEEGELVVRGPQVFGGYLHQEQLNEKIFADGWFRTGDMAVMEADGFVKIVSRLKEMIVTGGFNVYPAEVEEALLEHPEVKEAAVVGLSKEDGSERVVAAVTLAEAAEGEEHEPRRVGEKLHDSLRQHCKKVLTGYKVPREFFHVATLPADQMGKVRRTEMRAILEELERR